MQSRNGVQFALPDSVTMASDHIAKNEAAETAGPYVVWEWYGYEGWHPKSYPTLKDALAAQKYNSTWVVQKAIEYDVTER